MLAATDRVRWRPAGRSRSTGVRAARPGAPGADPGRPPAADRAAIAAALGLDAADLDATLPVGDLSTGLRYLMFPCAVARLARATIMPSGLPTVPRRPGRAVRLLLDAAAVEGRHWNNDGAGRGRRDRQRGRLCRRVPDASRPRRPRRGDSSLRRVASPVGPSRIAITAYGTPDRRRAGHGRRRRVGGGHGHAARAPAGRRDRRKRRARFRLGLRSGGRSDSLTSSSRWRRRSRISAGAAAEAPIVVFAPAGRDGDVHVKSAWMPGRPVFTVKVAAWFAARATGGRIGQHRLRRGP